MTVCKVFGFQCKIFISTNLMLTHSFYVFLSWIFTKFLTIIPLYLSVKPVSLITKLFRFYILSSTHVALAVLSLSYLTHLQFDVSLQTDLFAFIFCATVGTYNFIRYYASSEIKSVSIDRFWFFIHCLGHGFICN